MTKRSPVINLSRLEDPVLLRGNSTIAYRDPAAVWQDGTLFLYLTICRRDPDGHYYWFVGLNRSSNLETWTDPTILTPRDQKLNYCGPGNLIRHNSRWVMCLSSYPTPNDEDVGDATARAWTMRSDDLVT